MSQTVTPDYVLSRTYRDFDQMCEEIRQWDLDFRQLERGPFSSEIFQFGCGGVHISEARFRRRLHQRGAPPQGLRTIAVLAHADIRIQWRGHACTGNDLLIFPRGAELDSVSDEKFHVFTCSFPEELLAAACEASQMPDLEALLDGRNVVRCKTRSMTQLRKLLSRLTDSRRANPRLVDSRHQTDLMTATLPQLIVKAIAESSGDSVPAAKSRREFALNLALRSIDRAAHEPITVPELCNEAGVSQRTLQYIFSDRFGVTPKAFLLSYRLNMVRRELRQSTPQVVKVADIANRWGFWHMGQFAADYRTFFGELPSATLKNGYLGGHSLHTH